MPFARSKPDSINFPGRRATRTQTVDWRSSRLPVRLLERPLRFVQRGLPFWFVATLALAVTSGHLHAQSGPRIIDVAPPRSTPELSDRNRPLPVDLVAQNAQPQSSPQSSSQSQPHVSAASSPASTEPTGQSGSALQLPPRDEDASRSSNNPFSTDGQVGSLTTIASSLGIVLGLFLLLVWFCRRTMPKSSSALPQDAVQMLGRAPLSHRQFVHLVRVGNKLVLLSVTPQGAEPLTEITDPAEVEHLLGLCQQNGPHSVSDSFRQILHQFADEAATRHNPNDFAYSNSGRSTTVSRSRSGR